MEKLTRENAAMAAEIEELRRVGEGLKAELALLEAEEKHALSANSRSRLAASSSAVFSVSTVSAPVKSPTSKFSMGKNRVGTLNSNTPTGSPAPLRRPSEPVVDLANSPGNRPSPPPPLSPPKSPLPSSSSTMRPAPTFTRAESVPVFRERAATSSVLPAPTGLTKSSKLAALLGEEIQELPVEEGLVYMRDKETDAVLIRGGTLDALIGKLITAEGEGKAYTDSFLITYRSFIDPPALFERLATKYAETSPDDKNYDRTRLKILAFCRTWVDKYFFDWIEFPAMLESYRSWLSDDLHGAQAKVTEKKKKRGGEKFLCIFEKKKK